MSNLNERTKEDLEKINESKDEIIKRGKEEFDRLKKNIPVLKELAEEAKKRILKDLNEKK